MRRLPGIIVPLSVVVGLLAACGDTSESSSTTGVSTTLPDTVTVESTVPDTVPATTVPDTTVGPTLPAESVRVAAYFVRDELLAVAGRDVSGWDGVPVMEAVLAGPTPEEAARGLMTMIPEGTEVLGVDVQGSEATVNLSSEFESGGGSLSMTMRVAQVVYTVSQLPDVDTVRFQIDGEPRTMIGGEGIMVDPASRESFTEGVLPNIFLGEPFDGDELTNPIVIAGMTNAFEATVNYQVLAADGTLITEGYTTALCGTGCWGGFYAEIALPEGTVGPVTLKVFDYSEADGTTVLDLQQITLR
ncbi:MAG: GerMN domain-containing protein [Actinobacteria bacterium]|nr:GerMN domain-containing protein [Actinomycetota bacterium]